MYQYMAEVKLTTAQKSYLVSELKEVVDNYEVYDLDSPNDYGHILSLLTEVFNEDWHTSLSEDDIDDYLVTYFKKELAA